MKLNIIFALMITLLCTSCFEDESDKLFRGAFVEFDETSFATNPNTFVKQVREDGRSATTQVNLVGAHRSTDQVITFSVDPESTAVLGTNYELQGNELTIPANSSFGFLSVDLLDSPMGEDESVTLILILEGNNEIRPSENYKRFTYQINGI